MAPVWTRYFNVATETAKEKTMVQVEDNYINSKPNGWYLALDDDWIKWCDEAGFQPSFYSHKKILLNVADFNILELADSNICQYLCEMITGLTFRRINWEKVRADGFEGARIPSQFVTDVRNRGYTCVKGCHDHLLSLTLFDVDTLIIWSKREKVWTTPLPYP